MKTPDEILRVCGGTASRQQLLMFTSPRRITQAVRSGCVRRLRHGYYGLPELPSAVENAVRNSGAISYQSAAAHWDLKMLCQPARTQITVVRGTKIRHRADGVDFHTRPLPPHVLLPAGHDVFATNPLRTVLDCASALPFREGLAIADSALAIGLISRAQLADGAQAYRGPLPSAVRLVAAAASGLAANPFESGLRAACIDAGLKGLVPQHSIATAGGVYRVDLADPENRLAIEADSFEWHGGRAALDRDCRRYNELVRAGWVVLRFSWEQVMYDPAWIGWWWPMSAVPNAHNSISLAEHGSRWPESRPS